MRARVYGSIVALAFAVGMLALPASGLTSPAVAPPGVTINYSKLPGLQTGPVPWTADSNSTLRSRLDRLGLPVLGQEQLDYHIHAHLDIAVEGVQIPVPALIGIDVTDEFLTVLHTHDVSGVVHIESASNKHYTLGKFFGVWGVRLNQSCIGRYCVHGATTFHAYLNGKLVQGNPASIVLNEHEEIVLVYGNKSEQPKRIPKTYKWPAGL
jgi:hypothetical protein